MTLVSVCCVVDQVVLLGTKGILTLNSVWGADKITCSGPAMHPGEPERDCEVTAAPFEPPAAAASGKWSGAGDGTAWRSGMAHEIREVQESIVAGRKGSAKWPMAATIKVAQLMDAARAQMGVRYASDAASITAQQASASL